MANRGEARAQAEELESTLMGLNAELERESQDKVNNRIHRVCHGNPMPPD